MRRILATVLSLVILLPLFNGLSVNAQDDSSTEEYENISYGFTACREYDFDNETGIRYNRFMADFSYLDGGISLSNEADGGGVWLGDDPQCSITVNHRCALADEKTAAYSELLRLEADVTYRISFKYKYFKGSANAGLALFATADVTAIYDNCATVTDNVYTLDAKDDIVTGAYESELTEDTELYTASVTFTVGPNSINLGIGCASSDCYAWVDGIVIERYDLLSVDKVEKYDWTSPDGSFWYPYDNDLLSDSDRTYDDITRGSFVDANGLHFSFAFKGSPSASKTRLVKKALVKKDASDPGLYLGKSYSDHKPINYLITVKYKTELIAEGETAFIGIGYGDLRSLMATLSYREHTEVTDEWHYLTAIATSSSFSSTECLHLTGGSRGGRCCFLVESVTVRTTTDNIVKFNTKFGTTDFDAAVVPKGGTVSNFPAISGTELEFDGWYYGDTKCDSTWAVPEGCTTLTAKFFTTFTLSGITYSVFNGAATLEKVSASKFGRAVIPSAVKGFPVTKIKTGAFKDCNRIVSVSIPDTVTEIPEEAFYNCTGLTTVELPDTLKKIDDWAFAYCSSLSEIDFPESIESIGLLAFGYCTGLTSLHIPAGVTYFGSAPFRGCSGLESITVDADNPVYHSDGNCLIETEENELLLGCKTSVIPDDGSVTAIDSDAFYRCTGLTSITVPDSITKMGHNVFFGCTNLSSVVLGDGLTLINQGTFRHCEKLESIVIPENVTVIYDYALEYCYSLKKITLPKSLTRIGTQVFNGCDSLTNVYFNGTEAEWDNVSISEWGNVRLNKVKIHFCPKSTVGDIDGDGTFNGMDVIYLLYHSLYGSDIFPVSQDCDFDKDGSVTEDDAVYLLYHDLFGDEYPL